VRCCTLVGNLSLTLQFRDKYHTFHDDIECWITNDNQDGAVEFSKLSSPLHDVETWMDTFLHPKLCQRLILSMTILRSTSPTWTDVTLGNVIVSTYAMRSVFANTIRMEMIQQQQMESSSKASTAPQLIFYQLEQIRSSWSAILARPPMCTKSEHHVNMNDKKSGWTMT
jgi:hypothetical protein